jgi:hypothetical protein
MAYYVNKNAYLAALKQHSDELERDLPTAQQQPLAVTP